MKKLYIRGVANVRDLGGYIGADGRKVQYGRLIRSGHLGGADKLSLKSFAEDYNIRAEVDFRTALEINQHPPKYISGVKYYNFPALDEAAFGITTEKGSLEKILQGVMESNPNCEEYMRDMYINIAFSDYTLPQYKKFMELLLSVDYGATVFHCSHGKDRAGLGAVVALMALGVDKEEIIKDYMYSSNYTKNKVKLVKTFGKLRRWEPEKTEYIAGLLDVRESYVRGVFDKVEKECGGPLNYITEAVGLSEGQIEKFREMYLEK